jgi:RNA polymerase sigma factor (sigma-70 family)
MKAAPLQGLRESERRREAGTSDADLMRRMAGGELSPLGVLYDRHHEGVRQFVARAASSSADADDITQEAFLTLAKIAARYDGRVSARPFLLGIAAQLVRRRKRGLRRWAHALALLADTFRDASHADGARTPEDAASTTEEMRRFDEALGRLTEEKRLVFLLVEREGLSGEDVAQALEIPVNTVWTRLHHARNDLRKALAPLASGVEGKLFGRR